MTVKAIAIPFSKWNGNRIIKFEAQDFKISPTPFHFLEDKERQSNEKCVEILFKDKKCMDFVCDSIQLNEGNLYEIYCKVFLFNRSGTLLVFDEVSCDYPTIRDISPKSLTVVGSLQSVSYDIIVKHEIQKYVKLPHGITRFFNLIMEE